MGRKVNFNKSISDKMLKPVKSKKYILPDKDELLYRAVLALEDMAESAKLSYEKINDLEKTMATVRHFKK